MTTYFHPSRVWQLLKIDITFVLRYLLISLTIPVILVFFMSLNASNGVYEMYNVLVRMMSAYVFLGGIIFTSYAFSEMHDRSETQNWFMLPASTLEKVVAKWLLTFAFYFLLMTAGMLLITFFMQFLFDAPSSGYLFLSSQNSYFSHTIWPEIIDNLNGYLLYHAIFFLGAAVFAKWVVIKTVLAFVLTMLGLALLAFTTQMSLFMDQIKNLDGHEYKAHYNYSLEGLEQPIFIGILILLWVVTYFVIKRKQVSHAV